GRPERPQVPGIDAVPRQLSAGRGDVDLELAVEPPATVRSPLYEPELLELPREARLHPRPLAQLVELDLFLLRPCPKRAPTPPLGRAWRGELLTDDAQRQELVALEPEDRLEPLDVVLAEHPIPALRPARGEQSLVLEVADLRDRDVRELLLQHPADGPDRQPTSLRSGRAHR